MVKAASKRQHGKTAATTTEEPQQQPATRSSTRGSTTKKQGSGGGGGGSNGEESSEQTQTTGVESIKEEPVRKRRIASLNAELLVHYCSSTPAVPPPIGTTNPNGTSSAQSVNSGQSISGEPAVGANTTSAVVPTTTTGRPRRRTESNDSKGAIQASKSAVPVTTATTSKTKQVNDGELKHIKYITKLCNPVNHQIKAYLND